MKDQYNFLKAIDTSSSSPELLNEAEAALRRARQKRPQQRLLQPVELSSKLAQSNGQTPTATNSSSSINSRTAPGKLRGNLLTNLVSRRPMKLHSRPQQQVSPVGNSQNEKPEAGDLRDRLFSLAGGKQQHLKSSGGVKLLGAPRLSQPPVCAAPVTLGGHTRHHHHHHHHHVPAPPSSHQNKTTSGGGGAAKLNYLPSETAHPTQQGRPELVSKCYDEIDQIYDYIRGLAPLPANLRKIKSIDFEQLERDRQKLAERQQQQQQKLQVQHHQHRERYVRSIGDSTSTSHSASVASTQPSSGSMATRRPVKVRQRDASDRNPVRPPPTGAPVPIRVTTRSSESARPSIKRVESLNLGQQASQAGPAASRQVQTGLTKPSYLISTTQRGQVFRLPRAHSTSTLNKPALAMAGGQTGRRASQAQVASVEAPGNQPLAARLSRVRHADPLAGSLSRSLGRQAPGFESDLVESFVDDDEAESGGEQQVARDGKSASSQSRDSSSTGSSSTSSREEEEEEEEEKRSGSPRQASERLSQKSHSDYDNDSDANTSETTTSSTETSSETTTNTSDEKQDEEPELEGLRARARALEREHQHAGKTPSSMSPFSGGGDGGKRSQRPTTSSSPSSGRPASPADETQPESDDGRESTQRRKSASCYRDHLPLSGVVRPAPREEHIYEQIPAHKTRETTATSRVLCADQPIGMTTTTTSQSTLTRRAPVGPDEPQKPVIKHPVAYAANVAVNRRYQQQVAALFALQQRRDRQLAASQPPLPPVAPHLLCHQGHRRRASASNTQFLPQWRQATSSSNHHHQQQHLSGVPRRHRLSMGNIHLLTSAIPLASLYSPKTRNVPASEDVRAREAERHRRRSQTNANSLDDHDAGSTGTTNSTSSYEAAIKNSEPNPLRIDMLAATPDGASAEQRHSAGRRSVGSGSGTRSLSNHLQIHNTTTATAHPLHQQAQQQPSSLVKVPKLSKQSHLLQRPLPKPPNHHRSSGSSRQLASKSASTNRTTTSRPPAIDIFN